MTDTGIDLNDLDWLRGLARALVREGGEAEDLVQDTVVAALKGQPAEVSGDVGRRRAWLGSVARRLAARSFRDRSRRNRRERLAARDESGPSTDSLVARAEFVERLVQRIRQLDEPIRTTVLLHFLDGRKPSEIAEQIGDPVDTVRWRIRRGLAQLRARISADEQGGWAGGLAFLLPLAHAPRSAVAAPVLTVSLGLIVKSVWFVPSLVVVLGLLFAWSELTGSGSSGDEAFTPTPVEVASDDSSRDGGTPVARQSSGASRRVQADTSPGAPLTIEREDPEGELTRWFGRVTTEAGEPIAGAFVFVHDAENVGKSGAEPRAVIRTGPEGEFRLDFDPRADLPAELGAVANGFLRNTITEIPESGDFGTIALSSGGFVAGRVVDGFSRPVEGFRLLASTNGGAISHVSPSQRGKRASRARLGTSRSTYGDSLAVTAADGSFRFDGLPEGEVALLSLDPGWALTDWNAAQVGNEQVELVVERRIGIRLEVFDSGTGQRIEKVKSNFSVELELSDGSTKNWGQWVGRGNGEVSFALMQESWMRKDLGDLTITKARFYGVAGDGERESEWSATPIIDTFGPGRVATCRVNLDPLPAKVIVAGLVPLATVIVDVRDLKSRLVDQPVFVSWRREFEDGRVMEDDVRLEPNGLGRFAIQVPEGKVDLWAELASASGSLPEWGGRANAVEGRETTVFARIPVGATAKIQRPADWDGGWRVRASYRENASDDWFGSWNYGTETEELVLRAMKGAEWRFQIRRAGEDGDPAEERIVTLREGQVVVVDGR